MIKINAWFFFTISTAAVAGAPSVAKPQDLVKKKYQLCGKSVNLQVAQTQKQHSLGLMHRSSLEATEGMIFVYAKESMLSFWMKNVSMDLDIAFFDEDKKLVNVLSMKAESPMLRDEHRKTYQSSKPSKYAVEMKSGWFKSVNLKNCRLIDLKISFATYLKSIKVC